MADGIFPSLVSRTRDVNAADNVIFTQLSDGTAAIGVTSGALDVNVSNVSIAVTASDLDIRDLTHVSDSVKVGDGTDFLAVATDGSIAVTDNNTTLSVDDGTGSLTVDASDLDIRDLTHVSDSVKVGDGTDLLAVNSDGSINVNIVSSAITGEIHNYDTSVNVAVDTADNHDYAVVNSVFLLKSVIVAGSGNIKFEVQVGPVASLATKAVGFLNGRQGDTKQLFFDPPIEVPVASTGTVRVIRTNRQGTACDVYSTIIGMDV